MALGIFTLILINYLFFISDTFAQWVYEDDGCRTPDRGVGSCIILEDCLYIVKLMENSPKPLSSKIAEILRSYHCGFEGRRAKVCCPKSSPLTNLTQKLSMIPDVSHHRNLRLLSENCGIFATYDKIINGNKTGLFEFPWMALISYRTDKGPEFRCGGSVINDRYILTAAHCLANVKYPIIGIRVGEHDIRTPIDCEVQQGTQVCAPPVQDLRIDKILPHPKYNTTEFSNDIGLVRVATKIDLSPESVKPVCLPLADAKLYNFTRRNVIVTGWGATETGRSSPELLKVEIPVTQNEECHEIYKNQVPITEKQMCAGGRNRRDSCGGDSGEPLQVVAYLYDDSRYVQHGIVSFGPRFCGLEGNPGVYTRTVYYMDWILDNMED